MDKPVQVAGQLIEMGNYIDVNDFLVGVNDFLLDESGNYWYADNSRINAGVNDFLLDDSGNYWFATGLGLYRAVNEGGKLIRARKTPINLLTFFIINPYQ